MEILFSVLLFLILVIPQSTIEGVWSSSDDTNSPASNARTLHFFDLPRFSVNSLTCVYTYSLDNNSVRACTITYTLKSSHATGTYSVALNISIPV
jgi:hypothetical protein